MAKKTSQILSVSQLIPDDKNFNKGSELGSKLMQKSLKKFGAGRSILLDKNGRIIAGNKTIEAAKKAGINNYQVVKSDGKTIIAVQRTDIDLDSKKGRELALADNASAKANIVFDVEMIEAEILDAEEWGIEVPFEEEPEEGPEGDNSITNTPREKQEPGKVTPDPERVYKENKYPLSIVLSKPEMMAFDEVKKYFDVKEDTTAFMKMVRLINEQNEPEPLNE